MVDTIDWQTLLKQYFYLFTLYLISPHGQMLNFFSPSLISNDLFIVKLYKYLNKILC